MGDGKWEKGKGKWEMGNGKWEKGEGGKEKAGVGTMYPSWVVNSLVLSLPTLSSA